MYNVIFFSFLLSSLLVSTSALATWIATRSITLLLNLVITESSEVSWLARFLSTVLSYATIFVPCYVLIHFTRRHNLHTLGTIF